MSLTEQGGLEFRIRTGERTVIPVEAAAELATAGQERQQHAREERFMLVCARTGMRAREDRSCRFPLELLDRQHGVGPAAQHMRARLDERLHEGSILVEHRPVVRAVLLEGEGHLGAAFLVGKEGTERAKREGSETVEE